MAPKGCACCTKPEAIEGGPKDKAAILEIAQGGKGTLETVVVQADDPEEPWHSADASVVVEDLASDAAVGLTSEEAKRRLREYGPNRLTPPRKTSFLERLWAQINNIVIWILFAAAIIEGALQSWAEFGLVLAVIFLNTAMGMIQEGKAEKAADAIKAMLSPTAKVKRDGAPQVVAAEELVPGDIVLLKSGDKLPADLRLITATNLQVQEAMLTGESVPTSKEANKTFERHAPLGDRRNMAYSATSVVSGQAEGIVIGTGDSAEIGQISRMVNTVEVVTNNLEKQMSVFGRWLAVIVLFIVVAAFLLAKFRAGETWQDAFESAVSIAVAVIPEGLPAMVTVVLAIGVTVMARNHAIVRQLPAVETLGSVNVICSDKTGTLTKNEMTAVRLRTASTLYHIGGVGYAPVGDFTVADATGDAPGAALTEAQTAAVRAIMEGAVLCNDSALTKAKDEGGADVYKPTGAPTEVALLTAGEKAGLDLAALKAAKPRVASIPFESEHKFMATVVSEGGKRVMYVKGASDRLLPICKTQITGDDLKKTAPLEIGFWNKAQSDLSAQGLRVLLLCRAELAANENLEGLTADSLQKRKPFLSAVCAFAILDPPRIEVVAAIKEAHLAGITVKMITGDHALTALAIGKMLGIAGGGLALTGPEVDAMSSEQLKAVAPECNIYARASPENKIRIVRALQDASPRRIVSMTGDGVNDAPALKAADVGVAMGITGTDVSKEAAKMVLADDNFTSIVAAVKEGRRVWDNIIRLLLFNLPVNMAQGISVLWAYILGLRESPLTVLQILLVNMVTSTTLGMALAAEPAEPDVMERPPRPANKRLIGKLVIWRMLFVSHVIVALVLGSFYWGERQGYSLDVRRAEAFCCLVATQIGYFITCRFLKRTTLHYRVLFGNPLAYASIVLTVGIMVFFTYVPVVNTFFNMAPLPGIPWARIAVSMVITYAVVEVEKALIDPVIVPLLRPVLRWINGHAPKWLRLDFKPTRVAGKLCKAPRTASMAPQRKGTLRRTSSSVATAAAHATGGAAAPAGAANGKKAEV
ncbi:carbonate dehydratase [Raphidocelis subcapitata]|uniref:Carbonate dehydratase n=1 Tax=Raphidocelis subcapitata TaxID=307507 RepID=A0A2V0PBS2_9CHLO|nr:carbonate dehydratase [Raphidocelis subcapitata]|eukprot:GBF97304.1 carbonate dehydratase [Raphidocelis subcapitata]